MKRHLNVLSRLQGADTLPFADELLPLAERATYEAVSYTHLTLPTILLV